MPKFPKNTERNLLETWEKLEAYETSFERQSEDAKVVQFISCTADRSCEFFFFKKRQAGMHILQMHRQPTYGLSNQYLTQSRIVRVYESSSREEETNQVEILSRTRAKPTIEDTPVVSYNKKKTGNSTNSSVTSGKDIDRRHQDEKMSNTKSSLMEEDHHTNTKYSLNIQTIHSNRNSDRTEYDLDQICN